MKRTIIGYFIMLGLLVVTLGFGIFIQAALGGSAKVESLISLIKNFYWYFIIFFLASSAFLQYVFTRTKKQNNQNKRNQA